MEVIGIFKNIFKKEKFRSESFPIKKEVPYRIGNLQIFPLKSGARNYTKTSYPIRYGNFSEIKTLDYIFQFNLKGEIKFIRGINSKWPHPNESLKRTDANDWVFYSTGGYNEIFYTLGEYYLPCLSHKNNTVWDYHPFSDPTIQDSLKAFNGLIEYLSSIKFKKEPQEIQELIKTITSSEEKELKSRAKQLHQIIGGRISVLPPDARHVDYDVIPLMISDGCLYKCKFCCVKTGNTFQARSRESISRQIQELKQLYSLNISNYNALFLGNHDALAAGSDLLCDVALESFHEFRFGSSTMKNPSLHLFGSVDSLLKTSHRDFIRINQLPYKTYINIGLESVDSYTLSLIGKPLETQEVEAAFCRINQLNRDYINIEITVNFIIGDSLPPNHYQSLVELTVKHIDEFSNKGAIYISPLIKDRNKRELLRSFVKLKSMCRLPTFLYLIHRL